MLPVHGSVPSQPQLARTPSHSNLVELAPPPPLAHQPQHYAYPPQQQQQQQQVPRQMYARQPPQPPQQQRGLAPGPRAVNGMPSSVGPGGPGAQMMPPPGMHRVVGLGGAGGQPQPQPGQVVGPSHPSHPQHAAWVQHQQQQHQQQQQHHHQQQLHSQQQQQYLPQPPPSYLPQPPPPPGHYLAQPPPLPPGHAPRQPLPHSAYASSSANSVPSSPVTHAALPYPPQPQPGGPPPLVPVGAHPHAATPTRSVSSMAGMRPPGPLNSGAPGGGGGPPQSSASPYAASPMQQPGQPPLQQPQQRPSLNGLHPAHVQQQMQPRPMMRQSIAPQPNTLLAAHLALNGTGPITATAAPTGPALARLSALNDAIMLALEKENPLDALRSVVAEHFTETGVIKIGLFDKSTQMSKVFEIPCSAFPRFQHLNHVLGVVTAFMTVHFVREFRLTTPDPASLSSPLPAGAPPPPQVHVGYLLQADDASWTSRFAQGTRVDLLGSLTLHLMFKDLGGGSAGLRIESLDFDAKAFEESVARGAMEAVSASSMPPTAGPPLATSVKHESRSGGPDEADEQQVQGAPTGRKGSAGSAAAQRGMVTRRRSASAKTEQDAGGRAGGGDEADDRQGGGASADGGDGPREEQQDGVQRQSKQEDDVPSAVVRVRGSPVGGFGITNLGMRCLEIAESVAQLQELIALSIESGVGPLQCLSTYGDRPRPPPSSFPSGAPPQPLNAPQPFPHSPMGQPPTPGAAPVAAALQNPSTSSFYSSVAASPGGRPGSAAGPGAGQGLGQGQGHGDAASPTAGAGGPAGAGGKRKAPSGASGQGDGSAGMDGDLGSPQKVARGAGGARGRGRGR
ncbi:uncharacterized protein RHOBADRAFT_51145 [Rhodotorula graminis WP1]|uniref:Uncharacterized protein n=1 Tax=Rhodotorula graminis (strain WP1) TaxID=578459 RepID=A0A194S9I8_RHOGW|nr:uncharacterized protein RHOBADRAFT_51145 [Rhodotorula graminis WP1]KPV77262.1 hypothetical protein RHOBADRAFT_51145 [Rhodotorula graminis WP1]